MEAFPTALEFLISQINGARETIYFPARQYHSEYAINLHFTNDVEHTDENVQLLRSKVWYIGEHYASKPHMGNFNYQIDRTFCITLSSSHGIGN